jgi:hypothetical protein
MSLSRAYSVLTAGGRCSSAAAAALSERHGSTPLQTAAAETCAERPEGLTP